MRHTGVGRGRGRHGRRPRSLQGRIHGVPGRPPRDAPGAAKSAAPARHAAERRIAFRELAVTAVTAELSRNCYGFQAVEPSRDNDAAHPDPGARQQGPLLAAALCREGLAGRGRAVDVRHARRRARRRRTAEELRRAARRLRLLEGRHGRQPDAASAARGRGRSKQSRRDPADDQGQRVHGRAGDQVRRVRLRAEVVARPRADLERGAARAVAPQGRARAPRAAPSPASYDYSVTTCAAVSRRTRSVSVHVAFSAERGKEVVLKVLHRGRGSLSRDVEFRALRRRVQAAVRHRRSRRRRDLRLPRHEPLLLHRDGVLPARPSRHAARRAVCRRTKRCTMRARSRTGCRSSTRPASSTAT